MLNIKIRERNMNSIHNTNTQWQHMLNFEQMNNYKLVNWETMKLISFKYVNCTNFMDTNKENIPKLVDRLHDFISKA